MKSLRKFRLFSVIAVVSTAFVFTAAPPTCDASDLSITAGSVACSPAGKKNCLTRNAGETISAAGKAVYLDTSTNTFKLCDNNASLASSKFYGITLNGNSTGQPVRVCYKDPAFTIGATVAVGDVIRTSTTAGGLTKTAADSEVGVLYPTVVGLAISTTKINLNPTRADVITTPTPTPTP